MAKAFGSNLWSLSAVFFAAALVSVLVYPGLFLTFKTSFLLWPDYCVEYAPVFILTSFFYQGGIQLWDFFAQMPYFHTLTAYGLFKFPNIVTALAYVVLAPFWDDSARLFHHVFAWGQMLSLLFLRVAGIFLLLKLVTKNRAALAGATLVFSVFYSEFAFMNGEFDRSFYPLGIYFAARFFMGLQRQDLIALIAFMTIIFGNAFLHGAYFYLPMHFLMISGVIWSLWCKSPVEHAQGLFWKAWRWNDTVRLGLLALLVMGPFVYIIKAGLPDLAFDREHSRIHNMLSPSAYFHMTGMDFGSPGLLLRSAVNFWPSDDHFFGFALLVLSLTGLIRSPNRLKWLFALEILFIALLTLPRDGINPGTPVHLLNALTNPLKTIPRSYRFACWAMLPYLLMPLAVLGIEVVIQFYKRAANARLKNAVVFALCLLTLTDICLFVYRARFFMTHTCARKPAVLEAAPQSGTVEYDFANPQVFPYRYTAVSHFSFKDEPYLWFPQGMSSDVHHVINQAENFTFLNGYHPRHKEFASWVQDAQMLPYLRQNDQVIFLAREAVKASPDALDRITAAGLARQVAAVEDPQGRLALPDHWSGAAAPKEEDVQYSKILGTLDDVNFHSEYRLQDGLVLYTLYLPPGFPAHLASSWFWPEQRYLRFLVEGKDQKWMELQSAQGELIRPYTFDVQNIRKGQLNAVFPKEDFPHHHRCVLLYPSPENQGVQGLWRRQFDNLGVTFNAHHDGWLVAHFPYDPKWKISIDEKPEAFYRVNKSFIGLPLAKGEHKVLFQYMPGSPLRAFLLISAVLTTMGVPALILFGLKRKEPDYV